MMEPDRVSHVAVSKRLKGALSPSAISRLRSGARKPSLASMSAIAAAYRWSVERQVTAQLKGEYAEQFEGRIAARG